MLRHLPPSTHPSLLVGLETRDDAGVFRVSEDLALVQTVDFFPPVVDDAYAFGAIAAANSLSDVYAMGGTPVTVLNIACFDPEMAPAEVWGQMLQGAADKVKEAGAVTLGGHTVLDPEPKFGMAVTGTVQPSRMFANTNARVGDRIQLSKPLGTGILTTAAKFEDCPDPDLGAAIASMSTLNRDACEKGLAVGVRCATDITGFGLIGHLMTIARASQVRIRIDSARLPILSGAREALARGHKTGGAAKNEAAVAGELARGASVPGWALDLALDPQTSGGLALFVPEGQDSGYPEIGEVIGGPVGIEVV